MSTLAFIPVKNAGTWMPVFAPYLERLTGLGQIIFSYGESFDNTLDLLKLFKSKSEHVVKVKSDPPMGQVMTSAQIGAIYSDLQRVMKESPDDYPETHIALLDVDVMRMPTNLLSKLRNHKKNIIAPYVWVLYHDTPIQCFYDTMVFRKNGYRFHPFDPPRNDGKLIQMDSVGTVFLVEKKVFLDIPYGDPYPHMKFCDDAREKGYTVWADPTTAVYHVDLTRFGMYHHEIEVMKAIRDGDSNPYRFADQTPYICEDGRLTSRGELAMEYTNIYTKGVLR